LTPTSTKQWLIPLILVIISMLVYLTGMTAAFVYDDHGQLEENTYLQNAAHIKDVLLLQTLDDSHILNGRRPWVLLSQLLDYRLWGSRTWGYRITNLIYHTASILLLYFLILLLSKDSVRPGGYYWFATVSALIFGLHPVLIESVHCPAFRADVMYSCFVLLYVFLGLRWAQLTALRSRIGGGLVMLGVLLLAVGSKEAGVIAPFCLFLVWWLFPVVRPSRLAQIIMLGCSLIVLSLFVWACAGNGTFQALNTSWNGISLPYPSNLFTLPWLWVRYLGLLIWPYPLIVDRILLPVPGFSSPLFWVGLLVFTASIVRVFISRMRVPWPGLAVGWMLLAFFPVANIIPLYNPMAERYMYFMTAGFSILMGWILSRPNKKYQWGLYVRYGLLGVILCCYMLIGLWRIDDWQDDLTLWNRTVLDEPRSARAHTWLGLELKAQEQPYTAMEMFAKASELNPHDISALINQGILLGQAGDLRQAEACMRKATMMRPDKPAAFWNLSVALQMQGAYDAALESALQAVALDPFYEPALRGAVVLLVEQKRFEEALGVSTTLLELDPHDPSVLSAVSFLQSQSVISIETER